ADARNGRAVANVYAAKARPDFNPLIVHVADLSAADEIGVVTPRAADLAARFWPGPLTLVLDRRPAAGIADLVTAGLPRVALRVPAHPVAQAVLQAFGGPVAAPSANRSGRISPTTADHVRAGLGQQVDAVLDAGPCAVGVESTILSLEGERVRLLREGGLPREVFDFPVSLADADAPMTAPGQLASHYAPRAALVMDSALDDPAAVRIGFGKGPVADFNLSESGDLVAAAARLFSVLHQADDLARSQHRTIAVAPIPETGLGRAINDRLRRAAAPRPAPPES
ncbi:MAG: L-threonylcarbamoyladenylate synthase, partial [Pseudomonadota bacterium]